MIGPIEVMQTKSETIGWIQISRSLKRSLKRHSALATEIFRYSRGLLIGVGGISIVLIQRNNYVEILFHFLNLS